LISKAFGIYGSRSAHVPKSVLYING